MLARYAADNILAMVEPTSPCHANSYVGRVGEPNRRLFKRWRDLVNTGIHTGLNSDWPFFGVSSLNPMLKLYAVVTGKNGFDVYESSEPCIPQIEDQTISVLQGLRMMTIEAAYVLHIEDRLGSIKAGKTADLVVLSADPFAVAPDDIQTIRVLLTMVEGKIEFQSEVLP
jgi:predicted amidohydrolase YtcJ